MCKPYITLWSRTNNRVVFRVQITQIMLLNQSRLVFMIFFLFFHSFLASSVIQLISTFDCCQSQYSYWISFSSFDKDIWLNTSKYCLPWWIQLMADFLVSWVLLPIKENIRNSINKCNQEIRTLLISSDVVFSAGKYK